MEQPGQVLRLRQGPGGHDVQAVGREVSGVVRFGEWAGDPHSKHMLSVVPTTGSSRRSGFRWQKEHSHAFNRQALFSKGKFLLAEF